MMIDINSIIEKNQNKYLGFLKELISADSTNSDHGINGNEINAQIIVKNKLENMGMNIDVFEPNYELLSTYKETNLGHEYKDRPNVVGVLKSNGKGKSIILNGHIDTMPFDNLDEWITHPLNPIEKDGKLYGRGSCDMKAGIAAYICAVEAIQEAGLELNGDIIIESVVDEEGGGNGTLACVAKGYMADAAIVTEPTELQIMPAHMGWLFYKIEVRGKALHSSMKWKGVNAIEKMMKIMIALQELERNWAIEKRSPILPPPTINFGTISGGMAGSVVADRCLLDFGLHYLPEDSGEDFLGKSVENEVFEAIEGVVCGDKWLKQNPPKIWLYQQGSGYEVDFNLPLISIMSKNYENTMSKKAVIRGCEYGSDARLLNNYGKTPTILFGPGSIQQAHSINEYVSIEQYYNSIKILANTIYEWVNS